MMEAVTDLVVWIWADNYDDLATLDDGSCDRLVVLRGADN